MYAGITALMMGYVLSQFYRAFLAVLTPVLIADLGVTAADLASASGWLFLTFAMMQLPIGASLDRFGPRRTTSILVAVGAIGAFVFSQATGAFHLNFAMGLIGIGCAPVLMASYFIFARSFPPAAFGAMAAVSVGLGSLGNIASSLPLSAAVEAFGWRPTVLGLAAATAAVAVAILILVRDPPRLDGAGKGSLLGLLRMPALWPILAMMAVCYTPIAGLRGLWIGPYFAKVHGFDAPELGRISLWIGLAMTLGNFAYGPLDHWAKSRKRLVLSGNAVVVVCLFLLWRWADAPPIVGAILLMTAGFFGSSFAIVVAHGRALIPPHLMGRGVTLLNLFGIAPVGLAQIVTGRIHDATPALTPSAPFAAVFLFFALLTALGLLAYLLARDRTD